MHPDEPTRLACEVLLEGEDARLLEQYRQLLNRDLRRRGWRVLSHGELAQALVARFLRDHRGDIDVAGP
jgi:hypothetical protein